MSTIVLRFKYKPLAEISSNMPSVFLSHSFNDKTFTRKLAYRLSKAGVTVWIDEAELRVGDSLLEKLASAIKNVDFVAAVISSNSVESDWVTKELQLSMSKELSEKKKVVLPILIDNTELPDFLSDKLYADFREGKSFEEGFRRLMLAITDQQLESLTRYLLDCNTSRNARHYMVDRCSTKYSIARVLIFWSSLELTQKIATEMQSHLTANGIRADIAQHRNSRPPDAIFVSRGSPAHVVSSVLSALPSKPSFIFPFDYTDNESGAWSEYSMSVGLHSDTHEPSASISLRAVSLPSKLYKKMIEGKISDRRLESLLDKHFHSQQADQ